MRAPNVVVLDYEDLVAGTDLSTSIEAAYGQAGLGKTLYFLVVEQIIVIVL